MFNSIFNTLEKLKRIKEMRLISKMNPDNVADAIKRHHPTLIQSWKIEAIRQASDKLAELVEKRLQYGVKFYPVNENDNYGVKVYLSGYQIWKMFMPEKKSLNDKWSNETESGVHLPH